MRLENMLFHQMQGFEVDMSDGVPYILPRNTYRNYKYVNIT